MSLPKKARRLVATYEQAHERYRSLSKLTTEQYHTDTALDLLNRWDQRMDQISDKLFKLGYAFNGRLL